MAAGFCSNQAGAQVILIINQLSEDSSADWMIGFRCASATLPETPVLDDKKTNYSMSKIGHSVVHPKMPKNAVGPG